AAQLKTQIYHFWKEFATFLENLPVEGLKEEEVGSAFDMFFDFITKHSNFVRTVTANLSKKAFDDVLEKTNIPIGQLSCVLRDLSPEEGARFANELQKRVLEKSRLKIPILIHDECLHGCMAKGSTIFPQSIAMSCTWDPELIKEMAVAIGKETRSRGIHQALSPTVNIARDPRCGRTEETYGEDPYLASKFAVAFVEGLQSQKVAATPKHYVANFVGDGGRDSYPIHFSERLLREIYFPAFKSAVQKAGALSIMSAYNSLDGIPCTSNKWLLTDVLRNEWGFKGYVVSDYMAVTHLLTKHKVVSSKAEAAKIALEAGMDFELPNVDCFENIVDLVKNGELSEDTLNESVKRFLRVKFMLGLFDNPYVDPGYASKINNSPEHRELALKIARESMVLLKNENQLLPLNKNDIRKIAVIGPNAAVPRTGGYSGYGVEIVTPLEGIKRKVGNNVEVYYSQGCDLVDKSKDGFDEAIKLAQKADVVLMFMGNSVPETEGEQRDRHNLDLPGVQEELIKAIASTGTPVVVVLINGSAVTMLNWIDDVKAIIEAWYPGEEGGTAITDIIFGDYNPSGKLTITFPRHVGQLPLYYNHKPTGRVDDYCDLRGKQPLFEFGYGLSYTKFNYSNLTLSSEKISPDENLKLNFDIENIGKYDGIEVAQLYIRKKFSKLARPVKELKSFAKVSLSVGEKRNVVIELTPEELGSYDENLDFVVEPGIYELMIGASSEDIRLKTSFEVKG
ncbi:MAG: glycoside hydrolase family 3 C-terminal domain-containing protein, partial [Thermotogae bacterium]|nr:glycoside hydrolase family 3 C-terminal domain-containing protein [Thermotogota bacterium]